ncbi:MAG: hypothetical protein WB607_05920 [Candidatus Acidiferrum sp.]|jgi:hypothetical protein
MKSRKNVLSCFTALLYLALAGCGGGSSMQPISVTISSPPASLAINATASLTAVVANDSKAAGVTWKVSCGASSCGSVNPTTSTGNNATTTYTAPSAVPTGNTVTVTATSVTDTAKSASATITITGTSAAVLADGNYVYRVSGEHASGPYFAAGVFTVSKGAITAGEQDYVDLAGGSQDTLTASGSSLTAASDGNFQLALATGNTNVGVSGVETFRGTLVSGTHAQITEFDSFAAAGGTLDLQTGTAAPSGGYAFNLGGADGSANANPLFIGGVIDITGTSLSAANTVFDYFDGGAVGQAQSFASGTVTAPDAFGRISISLTSTDLNLPEFALIGYIVSTSKIQLVESVNDTLGGTLGGTALGQGANAGKFTTAGVGGGTYVFAAVGEDLLNGTATFAGAFVLNSNGTVSGELDYNDASGDQPLAITGGNWAVDSAGLGRVGLTNVTVSGSNIGNGPYAFQLYLDGSGNALEVGSDTIQGSAGQSYVQTATQVSAGKYAIGAQGFAGVQNLPVWSAVGPVTLSSSLGWTGFTDYNVAGGTPAASVTLSGTTDTTNGQFSISGLNAVTPTPNTPEFNYFPIDSTRVLAIEMDDNQLGLFIIEGLSQ